MRLLTIYKLLAACVLMYSSLFVKDLIPMQPDIVPDTSEMEDRLGQGSEFYQVEQISFTESHSQNHSIVYVPAKGFELKSYPNRRFESDISCRPFSIYQITAKVDQPLELNHLWAYLDLRVGTN